MLMRQALNFAAHLAAGIAVGALAVVAYQAVKRRDEAADATAARPDPSEDTAHPA